MGTYCLVYGSYCPLFRGGLSCCSLPFFILCIYYIIRFFICQLFFFKILKFSEGFRPYPLASALCPVLLSLSCIYYNRRFFICQYFFFIFLGEFFIFFLSLPCKYIISKLFLFVKYKFWEDLCAN